MPGSISPDPQSLRLFYEPEGRLRLSINSVLPAASLEAAKEELRHRYLTATVRTIAHAKQEFRATYWSVQTDRGDRDFVTQNLQENAIWLSPPHLIFLDVGGNRFEITDTEALDESSRHYVATIL